jgi:hypothetical protein
LACPEKDFFVLIESESTDTLDVLLIALATTGFQIPQLGFEREDVVPAKTEKKLDTRHGGELCGPARGEPTKLVQLDGSQDAELLRE